jgi:hypothetical protein
MELDQKYNCLLQDEVPALVKNALELYGTIERSFWRRIVA